MDASAILIKIIVCFIAGLGAGFGTGFAGMSAVTVISPMLITFVGLPTYQAVGIGLASDILASAVSARTYAKNKNIDIKNGVIMMVAVLIMTLVGSWIANFMPDTTMGSLSVIMTLFLGLKFLIWPVKTTKEDMKKKSSRAYVIQSLIGGAYIGFVCGFMGAGGGLMMLLVLTTVMRYELKTAVGTSVFIMTFTAITGSVSHFVIGGIPDLMCLILCIIFTFLWSRVSSKIANDANPVLLNRLTGMILTATGIVIGILRFL